MNIWGNARDQSLYGKLLYPLQVKLAAQQRVNQIAKQEFSGETPNIFVGRYGYPNINVGLLNVEQYDHHDDPLYWSAQSTPIEQIIDLRSQLINSQFKANVKQLGAKFLELSRELAMADRPTDIEVSLDRKPQFQLNFDQELMPHGPRANLVQVQATENPHIPTKVERAVDAHDLKAGEALRMLSAKGIDEHYLTRLLSVGALGIPTERKLVPTRWSITATDDMLGKQRIAALKEHPQHDYAAYFGGKYGNYYLILCFPDAWSYELFESYAGTAHQITGKRWSTDWEPYGGRKTYASNTVGGYYGSRLGVVEKLSKLKRQATILNLRFITDEYIAPLGVWVCREATREAMRSRPIYFGSKELMLEYAKILVKRKFNFDLTKILKESVLLDKINKQSKLSKFL